MSKTVINLIRIVIIKFYLKNRWIYADLQKMNNITIACPAGHIGLTEL